MTISGAKNAALPIILASLLTPKKCIFNNVPYLRDVNTSLSLLQQLGAHTCRDEVGQVHIDTSLVDDFTAPYDLVKTMRASILVLGPLLARFGKAHVSLPGGCAIGARPVDMHLKGLKQMGAVIEVENGYISAKVATRLKGAHIVLDKISVGATENILMAASLADGETTIENAAREPEIVDLASCLTLMGAEVSQVQERRLLKLWGNRN